MLQKAPTLQPALYRARSTQQLGNAGMAMLHRDIECRLTLRILDGQVCASAHQDFDNGLVAETGSVMQDGVAGAIAGVDIEAA